MRLCLHCCGNDLNWDEWVDGWMKDFTDAGGHSGHAASQQLLDRQNSNAAAGPSKSSSRPVGRQRNSINYSLLAGNRKPDIKMPGSLHKGGKKSSLKQSLPPNAEVRKDHAALAVAAAIAEGALHAALIHSAPVLNISPSCHTRPHFDMIQCCSRPLSCYSQDCDSRP